MSERSDDASDFLPGIQLLASSWIWRLTGLVLWTGVGLLTAVAADPPTLQMEIRPSTIKLYPEKEALAAIVIRNPTSQPFRNIKLFCLAEASVNLDCNNLALEVLEPFTDYAWNIKLSFKPGGELAPGVITFLLEYSDDGKAKRIAVGSAEIQSGALEAADQVADVKIESSLEALSGQNPGIIYVVLSNKTNKTIAAKVTPSWPEFIEPADKQKEYAVSLPPHGTHTIPIGVKASQRVRPGKRLLLFNVEFSWGPDDRKQIRHKVVTQPVEVGVFGESQILTLLGVPSFLLLPGFLILTTIRMLWARGIFKVKGQPANFPWEVRSPEFILLAITISMIVTALYSVSWHNLLEDYNLGDIIAVWVISVFVIGILANAGVTSVYKWRLQKITPTNNENDPVAFMEKLARRGLKTYLPRAEFKTKVNNQDVVRQALLVESLDDLDDDEQKVWVTPRIKVTWSDEALDDLKTRVGNQLQPTGERDLKKLAEYLREGRATTEGQEVQLEVDWEPMTSISRPTQINRSEYSGSLGEMLLVDEENA